MADVPISGMPAVITAAGTDELADAQSGAPVTRKITLTQIKNFVENDDVSPAFGEMFFQANATETVIVTQGVPVKVAGTYVSGELQDFTQGTGTLTYTGTLTRKFSVRVNTTASLNLATANITVLIAKEGIVVATSAQSPDLDGVSPSFKSIGVSKIVELATNETIEVFVQNNGGTDNVTHQDISVIVGAPGSTGAVTAQFSLFSQTNTVTVSNTAAETTLSGTGIGSLSIAANTLKVGDSFSFQVGGDFTKNAPQIPAAQALLRFGDGTNRFFEIPSSLLAAFASLTGYSIDVISTVQAIGGAGVARIHSISRISTLYSTSVPDAFIYTDSTNFDTTVDINSILTVQFNQAQVDNLITSKVLTFSRI